MTRRSVLALFGTLGAAPAVVLAQDRKAAMPSLNLSDAEGKAWLSPAAYDVLRHEDTERPFSSPLNNEERKGVYHCAGCAQALFNSDMKSPHGRLQEAPMRADRGCDAPRSAAEQALKARGARFSRTGPRRLLLADRSLPTAQLIRA